MAQRVAGVTDIDLGFNKIIMDLLKTNNAEILIGVQEGSLTKVQSKGDRIQESGISIAQYAAENEFGTNRIPERSFMRSTMDEKASAIQRVIRISIGKVIDNVLQLDKAYNQIGLAIAGLIQKKIRDIVTPPNSPYTIALKKSSKPLIDFGQMIASIRHVVRKKTAV